MTRARWKNTFEGVLLIGLLAVSANAVGLTGCSGLNTGSGGQSSNSIYMTNGKCQDSCQGYAFAITQWQNCWCSNMAPGDTTDSGSCNQKCPGYPDESCGNQQQGLYGYIALGKAPMGTMGAGGSGGGGGGGGSSAGGANGGKPIAPASTVVIAPSSQPQTVVQVSTQVQTFAPAPPPSSFSPPPAPPSSAPPSTIPPMTIVQTQQNTETQVSSVPPSTIVQDGPTSTISSVATVTPTPVLVTSAEAITVGGSVVTNYITTTPSVVPKASPANEMPQQTSKGLSSGAVAGITVAGVLGAGLIIAALIFLLCWRRRKSAPQDNEGRPKRNTSVLSRVGLLRNSNNSEERPSGRAEPTLPQIRTTGLPPSDGPSSALTMGSSQMGENRRFSRPLFSDNRLNPNALMTQTNLSRTSVSTLQDNQDYSRPLEVRNPDA